MGIAVEDHRVGSQLAPVGQPHAAGAALAHQDALHGLAEVQAGAAFAGQPGQGKGQRMHAAAHRPHAGLFDVRNEHQRSRRLPRRGAAVGGVTTEQLAQPGIMEVLAQARP
jgi:hypothetical protein